MEAWNEWSWLAIPTTAWAAAWWLRGLAGCAPIRWPRFGAWTVTHTPNTGDTTDG